MSSETITSNLDNYYSVTIIEPMFLLCSKYNNGCLVVEDLEKVIIHLVRTAFKGWHIRYPDDDIKQEEIDLMLDILIQNNPEILI